VKRALTVLVATGVGVVWLVTYRVTPHDRQVAAAAPPPSAGPTETPEPATSPSAVPSPTPSPQGSRVADGRFTGQAVSTIYGDVQVRVTVTGGRLTDVQALQLPSDRARSAEISQAVEPMLREEAIQAHSAQIDGISGATFTSYAYAQSLESALQQDHLG
jgi:uncharacterized protein with FMN-binding domain